MLDEDQTLLTGTLNVTFLKAAGAIVLPIQGHVASILGGGSGLGTIVARTVAVVVSVASNLSLLS